MGGVGGGHLSSDSCNSAGAFQQHPFNFPAPPDGLPTAAFVNAHLQRVRATPTFDLSNYKAVKQAEPSTE